MKPRKYTVEVWSVHGNSSLFEHTLAYTAEDAVFQVMLNRDKRWYNVLGVRPTEATDDQG